VLCPELEARILSPYDLLVQMLQGTAQRAGEVEAMPGLCILSEVKALVGASLVVQMGATTGDIPNSTTTISVWT